MPKQLSNIKNTLKVGFSNIVQQLSYWFTGQVVTATQMNAFSQDLYNKIAAITDRYTPCIVATQGSIVQGLGTITLPTAFIRFIDASIPVLPVPLATGICGVANGAVIAVGSNTGFIVARYTVTPTTSNGTNYQFPTQYLFVTSVAPNDCMIVGITAGQISSYGQFFSTPSINDNGAQVTVNKPTLINGINTQGGGIVASGSNSNGQWVKFANGLIMQWGSLNTGADGSVTVVFPISFTSAVISRLACEGSADGWGPLTVSNPRLTVYGTSYRNLGQMLVRVAQWDNPNFLQAEGAFFSWQAIGY